MRHISLVIVTAFLLGMSPILLRADSPTDSPSVLKFSDLADHPERWPDQVKMTNELEFADNTTLAVDQAMRLISVDANGALVSASTTGVNYNIGPDDSDVVAAANAMWSKLGTEQRHLTLAVIQADASLWPLKLKTKAPISFSNGRSLPVGSEVNFLHFHEDAPSSVEFSFGEVILNWAPYDMTDLFPRARELAALPRDSRRSRVLTQLKGNTVDSDGKLLDCPDKGVKYVVLYFSASWWEPCRNFAPQVVAFQSEVGSKHPELAIVMVSEEDRQETTGGKSPDYDADMLNFMKDYKMNWIALPPSAKEKCPNIRGYGNLCAVDYNATSLVLLDRFGTILAAGPDNAETIKKLTQILETPAPTTNRS